MRTEIGSTWQIEASPTEIRLIIRALRGLVTDEGERKQALELANLITEQRFKSATNLAESMKKHFLNSLEGKVE